MYTSASQMTADVLADLKQRVTAVVLARGGVQRGAWIRFTCPNGERHEYGDRTPSAGWEEARGVWKCLGCGLRGGARDLAERLRGPLPPPRDQRQARPGGSPGAGRAPHAPP